TSNGHDTSNGHLPFDMALPCGRGTAAALEIATGYKPDRGGKRRAGPTAEVELMQSLMESYAALRNSFPSSGPQPAFDRALKQFVRSCLRLVDPRLAEPSQITDAAIRGAFTRSRPNQRGKPGLI